MFEWNSCYCLEIEVVDGQHRNLFRLATELQSAIEARHSQQVLADLTDGIVRNAQAHFQREERMMLEAHYPNLAAHKAEHDALLLQLRHFQRAQESGRIAMGLKFLRFLNNWLEQHIMQTDRLYVPYLKAKSVA